MQVILLHHNQIGDFCFSLPVAAAIKQSHPQAEVCSVLRPNLVPLAQRAVPIDSCEIRPRRLTRQYWSLITRLRNRRADLAVVLPTSPGPCILSRVCGAQRVVGFDHDWGRRFIAERVAYEDAPSLANNLRMAEYLTGQVVKRDYVGLLTTTAQDRRGADQLLQHWGPVTIEPIVLLAPFSSSHRRWKCWPPQRFAQLSTLLYQQAGLHPVIVGSSGEVEAAAELVEATAAPVVNLVGHTDTAQLLSLLTRASLFIGQDSGPTHLSAALGRPTLAIFGPTDPQVTGPLGDNSQIVYKNLPCSPCHEQAAECPDRQCLLSIQPEEVADQALSLMEHVSIAEKVK